jgi:hypothetical protein
MSKENDDTWSALSARANKNFASAFDTKLNPLNETFSWQIFIQTNIH